MYLILVFMKYLVPRTEKQIHGIIPARILVSVSQIPLSCWQIFVATIVYLIFLMTEWVDSNLSKSIPAESTLFYFLCRPN